MKKGDSVTDMIRTSGIVKRYGKVTALDGLDLVVPRGTVLGLLGPNGAGKTTAVRILTTLLEPDEGTAEVAGLDVRAQADEVRHRIGLSGQNAAVDEHLTGYENLDMVGRLYRLGRQASRARARELLEAFDLAEAGDRPAKTYSGGMRRRLDLAAALVARPEVLFLDEPTASLDPGSTREIELIIKAFDAAGTKIVMATHNLGQARRLADEVIYLHRGRVLERGPAERFFAQPATAEAAAFIRGELPWGC
jgi:ABC-2 type transport system ATP-binding protein